MANQEGQVPPALTRPPREPTVDRFFIKVPGFNKLSPREQAVSVQRNLVLFSLWPSSSDEADMADETATNVTSPAVGAAAAGAAVPSGVTAAAADAKGEIRKLKKKKVLLMGKSGSGKSSMRSIIFSNYLPPDTRRLGATIDVDLSHVKFLGNLTLNLWDCGGQEAFMENYINQQRVHVFSNVGVLIYVFDVESRDGERDLATYVSVVTALAQYSPTAKVFILVHKMDLIITAQRESVFNERVRLAKLKTTEALANMAGAAQALQIQPFATSIWDQSLYKAWSSIIHDLVPNLAIIEQDLSNLGRTIEAEEVLLFERTSFLVISHWTSEEGIRNPNQDRFERLSNIFKSFKASQAKYTGTSRNSDQMDRFEIKMGSMFTFFIQKFTTNTFLSVSLPPGETRYNSALVNVAQAAKYFERLDSPAGIKMSSSQGSGARDAVGAGDDLSGPSDGPATGASGTRVGA